jgi:hypothetical protein
MKRGGFALLLALSLVGLPLAQTARADIDATDPDDAAGTFDMSRLEAHRADEYLVLRIRFYDDLIWTNHTSVTIWFDSRGAGRWEYYIRVSQWRGKLTCTLYSRDSAMRLDKLVWPRRITIVFLRSLLHPTHAIRWKVRAASIVVHEPSKDWAPGSFMDWFPHV